MSLPGSHIGCNLARGYYGPGSHVPCDLGQDINNPIPVVPAEPPYRGHKTAVRLRWKDRRAVASTRLSIVWPPTQTRVSTVAAPWHARSETTTLANSRLPWAAPEAIVSATSAAWSVTAPLQQDSRLAWRHRQTRTAATAMPWAGTTGVSATLDIPWPLSATLTPSVALPWIPTTPQRNASLTIPWPHSITRIVDTRIPWGDGDGMPDWIVLPPETPPPNPIPEGRIDGRYVGADLGCPAWAGPYSHIPVNLGVTACYNVRPRRRTYVVENEVSIVRLPDLLPIDAGSGEITRSVDSWAASMSFAVLSADSLAALKPTGDGPRKVRVTANGYAQDFIVEDWKVDRRFAQVRYSVTGRSQTALLDAPYAPVRSRVETSIRTVAQLADIELTDTGFTCDWDTLDWTVPANAWSYAEQTPIAAIVEIAAGAGAVVQSHLTDAEVIVRPRYPASPWNWTVTAPDITIYDDLVLSINGTVQSKPRYNEVFVGAETIGVYGFHQRTGEGGGEYAPQVTHPLISTAQVHAEVGRNVLSDRGSQTHWTLAQMPLFAAPVLSGQIGLILPLQLAQVIEAGGSWLGLVTSTRLAWERSGAKLTVWQTATIARHPQDAN